MERDSAPVLNDPSGGSATRFLSHTGILIAGLLVGLMLFTSESSDQPPSAVAPLARAETLTNGDVLEMLQSGRIPPALRGRDLKHELIQTIHSVSPGNTANSSLYVSFWLNSNANTKRQIILLINELEWDAQNLPGLVDVAYPFLGYILLGGGESDEDLIRRMLGSLSGLGEYRGLRDVTRYIGEWVIANTPGMSAGTISKIRTKLL